MNDHPDGPPVEPRNQLASPIMRYFKYEHLNGPMKVTSRSFAVLAQEMEAYLPNGPEKSTALRKLLEAKDAAVRAAMDI